MHSPLLANTFHKSLCVEGSAIVAIRAMASTYVELHVRDDDDVLGQVVLGAAVCNRGVQQHIEGSFDVSVLTQIGTPDALNLIAEVYAVSCDQLRTRAERHIVSCEGALSTLCAVQTQGNCHIDRCRSVGAPHRTGGINNSQTVESLTIEVICQVLPILVHHQAISIVHGNCGAARPVGIATHQLASLSNNFVRIQSLGVNLGVLVLCEVSISLDLGILLHTLNVVASKGVLILQTSLGRDLVELDLVPAAFRHQSLQDINAGTQRRQNLTVLLGRHTQELANNLSGLHSLGGTGVLRGHPLCQQRRSLTLGIQSQLMLDDVQCISFQRSTDKHEQVIPAAELGHVDQVTLHSSGIILSQVLGSDTEEPSLTLATAHVADIEQALQRINRVLVESLFEQQDNIFISASTVSRTHSEQVHQTIHSGEVSQSAILGDGVVVNLLHTIQKSIRHSIFSFFSLYPLGQEERFCVIDFSHLPYIYIISYFF